MKALISGVKPPTRSAPSLPTKVEISQLISIIRAKNLSYCGPPKLENLAAAVCTVRAAGVPGNYLEAGVALGGSAILLALFKPAEVVLDLYDVFSMIPSPAEHDGEDAHRRYNEIRSGNSAGIGGGTYYGYIDNLLEVVKANLRGFGLDPDGSTIHCTPGLFEDTLRPTGPIALAHVDCDWYDSVRVCIEQITPHLSAGGMIIFDDYSSYSGCRSAVDEWLARSPQIEIVFDRRSLGVRHRPAP